MPRPRAKLFTLRETVSLSIPANWIACENDECCTFRERESGTLRLRLTISQHDAEDCSLDDLMDALFFGEPSERLSDNRRLRFQVEPGWENGEEVFAYSWTIAVPVDARRVRTAEFSYSVSSGREADPRVLTEVEQIDKLVRNAQFAGVDHGSRV